MSILLSPDPDRGAGSKLERHTYDLFAPTMVFRRLVQIDPFCGQKRGTYYRLGKNLPFSGIRGLTSLSAPMFQAMAVIPMTTTPITAVFAFQFAGCAYHPPAGDQTCLG